MAFAELWLPVIGAGICIAWAIGAWYGENKILAIWLVFIGLVCLLLLGALQIQHVVTEEISEKPDSSERPWISVTEPTIGSPLRFLSAGATITLNFPVRHTGGRNPAFNVSMKAKLIPFIPDTNPLEERDKFVAELKATPDRLIFGERTLFQGDAIIWESSFLVPKAEIDNASVLLAAKGMPTDMFLPLFVACAVYKLAPQGKNHYTCIVGNLQPREGNSLTGPFNTTLPEILASGMQAVQLLAPYVD